MSKLVQVKQCDIVRGECGNDEKCALSRALNRTFKQKGWVVRDACSIYSPYKKRYRAVNKDDAKVNRFIRNFDNGATSRPIKFSIVVDD